MNSLRIGIDTGGTFTDFVVIRDGKVEIFKELSTPQHPEEAIMKGINRVGVAQLKEIIHGSTVATNALLERKGARTALLTTAGFEDVIVIGRQTRRELYNIFVTRPEPLAPDGLRYGVRERTLYDGSIETPLDRQELCRIVEDLQRSDVESVAVSLLFSFANTAHEDAILRELDRLKIPVSLSSRILPEYREYERTSTTVINAYLAPLMSRYLSRLQERLSLCPLRVMQSNGGAVQAQTAASSPVRTIVSGPAGGVVGAFYVAEVCGYPNIITFDMGGTSTDVALCEGEIKVTHENQVDGLPVGIPMMDIHTVGAGGGSIAHLDPGGALKVGPESAGADPGPISYGRGDQLTVTDANILLGRLLPRFFLGGAMPLWVDRVAPAVEKLEWARGWKKLEELAQGVIDVVNNNMEQAIRLISVERGYDPRDFTLFCFGGAGGLHAAHLARGLGIPRVVVPQHPGALSALGLLLADARKDYSRTLLVDAGGSGARLKAALDELHRLGMAELQAEGFRKNEIHVMDFVDLRYRGQSYELTIPLAPKFVDDFHKTHERRYGYSNPGKPVELVNVRTTILGRTHKPEFRKVPRQRGRVEAVERLPVWLDGKGTKAAIYDRAHLKHGHVIKGPAIIGEYSSTTLAPAGFVCRVDAYLNLVLEED
ncbi:MAG: hydantoinase/oxoprolinase family protein [Acidobacteria bacterium]|nr:hydantoinase/oxoprolinase family protein [Acidobacteriota bacterium]